jgi:hypothetical protein
MRGMWQLNVKVSALIAAVALVLSMSVAVVTAEDTPASDKKGAEIMDQYVEATGGLANYDKIHSRYTEATLDLTQMGIKLDVKIWSEKPNKYYSAASSPAIGDIERATDGNVYWEKSVMAGPRILEGGELEEAKEEAAFDKYAYWRDVFQKANYEGEDSVEGKLCDKVVLTDKNGKEQTLYFDKNNHLLVRVQSTIQHQMGLIPVDMYLADYRKVDGLDMPFKTRMVVMGQDRVIVTDSIAQNIQIPDSIFAVPADIIELMESQDTTKTE